jgi:Reverse transcriptase (RNA-dependent DNA polymerase)
MMEDDFLTLRQDLESMNSNKLTKAMNEKIKSIYDNKVYDIVHLSEGVKPIDCKWIFKIKNNSEGNMERYKARLVAKRFIQKEDIDFMKTSSPVSMKDSIRIIMTLVTHFDLELHQIDVKTTFLNDDIDECIYTSQAPNYEFDDSKQMVGKLKNLSMNSNKHLDSGISNFIK